MARTKRKPEKKPEYKYVTTEVEAKYKIFMNPDIEKRAAIKERVMANDGYCPNRNGRSPENKCMCKQFQERDSEGFCKCRLYYKEERTKKAAAAYLSSTFEVNEKKEKELEKQMAKEEKAAARENES